MALAKQSVSILLTLLIASAALADAAASRTGAIAGTRILQIGPHRVTVEVAASTRQRALGLMHRDALAPDHGMLFVFDRAGRHCMFMRNTRIPLSAAFLDDHGKILAIARMQPFSEQLHCAPRPVIHVVEMDQGWFAQRGIGVGDRVEGIHAQGPGLDR